MNWKLVGRSLWRLDLLIILCLYVTTFGAILPYFCQNWKYSYYFRDNEDGGDPAKDLPKYALPSGERNFNYVLTRAKLKPFFLLITVVTVRRPDHYLTRVISKLKQLIDENDPNYKIMICDVDTVEHTEAFELSRAYQGVYLVSKYNHSRFYSSRNIFEKEREDYVFCLNASRQLWASDYILMLEDDAVPLDDLLPMTSHLLQYRLTKHLADFFYIKLYHPERLQGYIQPEPWRIAEWLALSTLGSLLVFACTYVIGRYYGFHLRKLRRNLPLYFTCCLVYFMLLTELVGRPHHLQVRRMSPHLYNVLATTECCMPAMLYSASSAGRVMDFLASIHCKAGYAKDTALYEYVRQQQLKSYVVEPNLVRHIGHRSSLRS